MITAPKSGRRFVPALAALVVCCLPLPAFSDELWYLPDNLRVVASIDVATGVKTKTFQAFMKTMETFAPKDNDREQTLANFVSKIGRMTMGVGMMDKETFGIEVATAVKSISADEYKALKKPAPYQMNHVWKEIKHGAVTIYQPTWQFKLNPPLKDEPKVEPKVIEGEAFYLAGDGKYVVSSRNVALLKKIIDRKEQTAPSPAMFAGLKDAGFNNTVAVVIDLQGMPASQKETVTRMFEGFPTFADIKANVNKVQSLTIKVNEPGKLKVSATLTCIDTASAAIVKMVGEKTLAEMKKRASAEPKEKLPPTI